MTFIGKKYSNAQPAGWDTETLEMPAFLRDRLLRKIAEE
jgi:hypothetical protein